MLEEKRLKEAEKRVKQYLGEGIIKTKGKPEHLIFFLKNADDSLDSARTLAAQLPKKCLPFEFIQMFLKRIML